MPSVIFCRISPHLEKFIPFAIYLPPGFFRVLALADRGHKKKCLYDFSKVFQLV